ncbi:aldo/keto reductase [Actinoplanes regularis]|uniref:Predicted oxidoreductase n=1 Tax=Actinoplanes regularis TaxID=52697 RepID=A0A239JMN0_9ACTN|nr:aldo/keto reductase [Actinoplanes regularis]GIE92068.1 aldo/keto reductase [Actinoplanes regularis]SNT06593.1 Predicted oxidoreductase [Actinoplanes regularis]
MQYPTLGRSGLRVSRACLGTMNFGTDPQAPTPEPEARRIVDAFLDAGHNLIDTADTYRGGTSEEVLGRAIAHRRAEVVLATKGAAPQGGGPNSRGLSRLHLTRALEASLRRLGTDYLDLYQCHLPDPDTPAEETMAVLDDFVRSGKVRYLGCSNFTAAGIVTAQWAAQRTGGTPLISLQANYSLIMRAIEAEIVPTCRQNGLGILAYSPLGSGLLAGRYQRGAAPAEGSRLAQWAAMPSPMARSFVNGLLAERHFDIADEVAAVAAELGTTAPAVALAWLSGRPEITSVIVGPRSADQLTAALAGLAGSLPESVAARLNVVSQGTVAPAVNGQHRAA